MNIRDVRPVASFTVARTENDTDASPVPVIKPRRPMPYPNGWFALCHSDELKRGDVRIAPFMGHELVVYRTAQGEAHAVEPYCPHLGAHLGHGGKVDGDALVCPFHGLAFGPDGGCVHAPNGRPPHAALTKWITRERNRLVLVWRDSAGRPPSWEIPEVLAGNGFGSPSQIVDTLDGYAHDPIENSTDVVHFAYLHGFTEVSMAHELRESAIAIDFSARYRGVPLSIRFVNYSPNCLTATATAPSLGVSIFSTIFTTPTAPLKYARRISNSVRVSRFSSLPDWLLKPVYSILTPLADRWIMGNARQDHPIWTNRNYLTHPKLMEGEASMAAFRRWMKQFYPE
ncbi:2Fe-2S ferredoxin [Burkholderia territorii]|uniref:Rieske 2Fe-2S domain-containing protein n=1 Tax=Burkholderia territorii TaxID=1503055 RepID=UPI00075AB275|nr:Rieske 2Fe-2S domain-containing protein [Burkholderia territorii]KVL03595.1 2Fe-2S ferredoxin [Burkholderia territorii]KVL29017.1 2Fe-2S ferredoxin [Burkholderia territorii]KVL44194.1 2Fe-2S ferredoxin [Burkholderia territorii]